ncbi:MAG: hypothetical protein HXS40_05775, partial [Theionarchaea archaeon]|nr:hypothetical protein [Theionarchaea archaeon]
YSHDDMVRADSDSEIILALHNLNVFLYEMERIREASRENNLEAYIEKRSQKTNRKVRKAFNIAREKSAQSLS